MNFFARYYDWVATNEYRLEIAIFEEVSQLGPKFQVEGNVSHQHSFMSQNQMHRSFMRYKNVGRCFFRFVTIHAFDRQTDGHVQRDGALMAIYRVAHNAAR